MIRNSDTILYIHYLMEECVKAIQYMMLKRIREYKVADDDNAILYCIIVGMRTRMQNILTKTI